MANRFHQRVTVEDSTASAFHEDATRLAWLPFVRRKPLADVPKRVFPGGTVPVVPPRLKIRSSSLREEHSPCALKSRARRSKGRSRSAGMLTRTTAGIEAATPLPLVRMVRAA